MKPPPKKITIIADGGFVKGLGHISRSLSLAKKLSKYRKVEFLTQSGQVIVKRIKKEGFKAIKVSSPIQIKSQLKTTLPGTVIIDQFDVKEQLARFIKKTLGTKLVIFGNASLANQYADLVINAVVGTNHFQNRSYQDKKNNAFYLEGPKYLIFEDKLYQKINSYQHRKKLKKILLTFGGSDRANLTSKVLKKLLRSNRDFKVNVVLGPLFKFNNQLRRLLNEQKDSKKNIKIYQNVNEVFKLMIKTDLVITSPGNTMFESFYLKVPTIAFYQGKLQEKIFKGFILTYNFNYINDFENLISSIHNGYYQYKKKIGKLKIGSGKKEIINKIINLKKSL